MKNSMLSVMTPTETDLVDIGVLFAVVALVSLFTLVWFFKLNHRKRRKRKHHHSQKQAQLTLSQRGGLPPVRDPSTKPNLPPTP
jgi:hypothetical protein